MNYTCKNCRIRQAVREGAAAPVCDCGQLMTQDTLGFDEKMRKTEVVMGKRNLD